jgi:hypothetical protein
MRHTQITRIIVLTIMLVLPAVAAKAQSSGNNGNGNICSPNVQSLSTTSRTQFGIGNTSTTVAAEVLCPMNLTNVVGNEFLAHVYNRNSSTSLKCGLFELDTSGNTLFTSTQGVAGSLGSGIQSLMWNNPPLSNNMFVDCLIPTETSGQISWVTWFGWTVS